VNFRDISKYFLYVFARCETTGDKMRIFLSQS